MTSVDVRSKHEEKGGEMWQELKPVKCQTPYLLQESFFKDEKLPDGFSGVMKSLSLDGTSVWECC